MPVKWDQILWLGKPEDRIAEYVLQYTGWKVKVEINSEQLIVSHEDGRHLLVYDFTTNREVYGRWAYLFPGDSFTRVLAEEPRQLLVKNWDGSVERGRLLSVQCGVATVQYSDGEVQSEDAEHLFSRIVGECGL